MDKDNNPFNLNPRIIATMRAIISAGQNLTSELRQYEHLAFIDHNRINY